MNNHRVISQRSYLRQGFTLTELLVAMTVSLILLGVVAYAIIGGSEGYQNSANKTKASVESRSALNAIESDAHSAITSTGFYLDFESSSENLPCVDIAFLVAKPLNAQIQDKAVSDLCHVHYYTAVTSDGANRGFSRKLYRAFISSEDVYSALKSGEDFESPTKDPTQDEPIAFNIIQFTAKAWVKNDSGVLVEWDKTMDSPPGYLDLTIAVGDDKISTNLRSEEDWNTNTATAQLWLGDPEKFRENKHIRVFYSRVTLAKNQLKKLP